MQSSDVTFTVLQYLEPKEVLKTCAVNKAFKNSCGSEILWKNLYIKKYIDTNRNTIFPYLIKGHEKGLKIGNIMTYKEAFEKEVLRESIRKSIFQQHPSLLGFTNAFGILMYHIYDTKGEKYMHNLISKIIMTQKEGSYGTTHEFLSIYQITDEIPNLEHLIKEANPVLYKYAQSLIPKIKDIYENLDLSNNLLYIEIIKEFPYMIPYKMKVWLRDFKDPFEFKFYNFDNLRLLQLLLPDIPEPHLKFSTTSLYLLLEQVKLQMSQK